MTITNLVALPYQFTLAIIRLAWAASMIQLQATVLFLQNLIKRHYNTSVIEKILIAISSCTALYFIWLALTDFSTTTLQQRYALMHSHSIELYIMRYAVLFEFITVSVYTWLTIKNLKRATLPKILKSQLKFFTLFFIAPYITSEFIANLHFITAMDILIKPYKEHFFYLISSTYGLILTFGLLYCIRKVAGLRFLNLQHQVQASPHSHVMSGFTAMLRKLAKANELVNLEQIIQLFFKEAFNVPTHKMVVYLQHLDSNTDKNIVRHRLVESTIEEFIYTDDPTSEYTTFLKDNMVFIRDEIEFSNFYDQSSVQAKVLNLLDRLNADVLIPLYDRTNFLGYILVEQGARANQFYTDMEQNDMIILGHHLAAIINVIQRRSLEALLEQQHKAGIDRKHREREIVHYRESVRSFVHINQDRKIGLLFYRNRRFVIGNQFAQDLLRINVNMQVGHPLSKTLKQITKRVEESKAPYSVLAKDVKGKRLALSAIPSIDQSHIIVTVHYPEISDILSRQIDMIKEQSDWDYLLYLETTHNGRLINQYIPASSPRLLDFKLQMLKLALSIKPILLNMHEKDLIPTVEILQHISQSTFTLTITLTKPCTTNDIAISIFGISPLFGSVKETPLLERLSNSGTLFIANIHYLDEQAQEHLAEYLRYGLYRAIKSEKKVVSNARIICSTTTDLETLVNEGKFSKNLYEELKATQLIFPSLASLADQEIEELVLGYAEQSIVSPTFKNILDLTPHERERLIARHPSSLQEIRDHTHRLMTTKADKHQIAAENTFDPGYGINDPQLADAARLGKTALRYPDVMDMLWKKFRNQNKIATFLGVNRSSVNRRCRQYKLVDPTRTKKNDDDSGGTQ